jgi:hypothetical protein
VAAAVVVAGLAGARRASAEVSYRDGLTVSGSAGTMSLNVFVRPRYEYESDDGTGGSLSTMQMNLLGARLRAWDSRGRLYAQAMGGMAVDEPVLLDSYIDLLFGHGIGLRLGYFKVGFDEQTAHGPFWLRMTQRSLDVEALSYDYDMGVALFGSVLRDSLSFSVSVTNGEAPSLENLNVDFLYAGRVALSLGRLLRWRRSEVAIGLGTAWTLEPWEPEPGARVNRSIFTETLDISARLSRFTYTAAVLYRIGDPGAYGPIVHDIGWHFQTGVFLGEAFEVAAEVAHLLPDVVDGDGQDLEVAVVVNAFPDRGRMRVQLEYAYGMSFAEDALERDRHRVVLQFQAVY